MTWCSHPIQICIRFKKIILCNNKIPWIPSECFSINESVGRIRGLFISSLKLQKFPVFKIYRSIPAGGVGPVDLVGSIDGYGRWEGNCFLQIVWFLGRRERNIISVKGTNYIKILNWDTLFVSNYIRKGKFLFLEMTWICDVS